jgi:GDP-L-fucose synthase
VAGHRGLVGSAVVRALEVAGQHNIVVRTHAELDLTDQTAARDFMATERPTQVVLAAAKVGGIHANSTYPADFIRENLAIQLNVIDAAYRAGVERLVFLGSSCIYPKYAPQPLAEAALLTGPLEPTNRPYALAKIAGIEMCASYNRQYGTKYLAAMPTNLYGPGDNYHATNSHVIPALIRRFAAAKESGADEVVVWGTGTPRREFLFSEDMASAIVFLMKLADHDYGRLLDLDRGSDGFPLINIGYGTDMTIAELANAIAAAVEYTGNIRFDPTAPDGTPRKLLDTSKLAALGWRPQTTIDNGLARAVADFRQIVAREARPL